MGSRDGTVKDALIAALRRAAAYNPVVEVAPCAILWLDPTRQWEALMPALRSELSVVMHGSYERDNGTGPAFWILYALAEKQMEGDNGCPPIVYLPGTELRHLEDVVHCPQPLQPLAGLQYRAAVWLQPDGREWTAPAFFRNRECGLGLELKPGTQTEHALVAALPWLLDMTLTELDERSPLRASDFEALGGPVSHPQEAELRALIAGGETDTTEFKETGRYNLIAVPGTGGKGQPPEMKPGPDPRLEREIWKTVGGFLNSRTGGALFVGVRDDKSIRGLEDDYSVTKGRGGQDPRDVWQLFVVNLLAERFGKWVVSCITVTIHEFEAKDICCIDVRPAPRPAWAKEGKPDDDLNEVFYLRSSGSTHRLPPSQASEYIRTRWLG